MDLEDGFVDPHDEHEQLVPFTGSGVSLFEPTSLPSWVRLVETVVAGLSLAAGEDEAPDVSSLAPQVVAETLLRRLGTRYLDVLRGLLGRPPNAVHEMLAENIIKGRYPAVLTTNFDRALEDLLEARGVKLCELHGVDAAADDAALSAQREAQEPGEVRVIVVCGVSAFSALERMPGLLGQPGTCAILKLHGDAKSPETCLDSELQRERGLPAAFQSALSVLLLRFPILFMGWSGGDLDHNEDYIRLRTEADKVVAYWLLLPGAPEPGAFAQLRGTFARDGGKLNVLRGRLRGSMPKANAFEAAAKLWATEQIGSRWAALALADLRRVCAASRLSIADASAALDAVPAKAHGREQAASCVKALQALREGKLDAAWTAARRAVVAAQRDGMQRADCWTPFTVAALVLARAGDLDAAQDLYGDACVAAFSVGNRLASERLAASQLAAAVAADNASTESASATAAEDDTAEIGNEDPLVVFSLASDNTARESRSGLPKATAIRGELFRDILVGDVVAVPQQFLLDSRVLITEVLCDATGQPHADLLGAISPLLDASVRGESQPLLAKRRAFVDNPRMLHEDIPEARIAAMQATYDARGGPAPIFFDIKPLADNYTRRVQALLADPETVATVFPGDEAKRAAAAALSKPLRSFVDAIAHAGALTRSDMYRWGDLLPERPTSEELLWDSLNESARERLGSREVVMEPRRKALERPWDAAPFLKLVADAPYRTNLPIANRFSILLGDVEEDARGLELVRRALRAEGATAALGPRPIVQGVLRASLLAQLSVHELLALRNSSEGRAFRAAARRERDGPSAASRRGVRDAAAAYWARLQKSLVAPEDRRLPLKLAKASSKAFSQSLAELDDAELQAEVLGALSPSLAPPPPPLMGRHDVAFPGLLVLGATEDNDEEDEEAVASKQKVASEGKRTLFGRAMRWLAPATKRA